MLKQSIFHHISATSISSTQRAFYFLKATVYVTLDLVFCEKASSYMKQQSFEEVYHLQGGILKYLETVPKEQSLWEGECFVFD